MASSSTADTAKKRIGGLEDAAHVVDRRGAVDVEAQLRQLQRNIALDSGCDDGVEDLPLVPKVEVQRAVRAADALRELPHGDAFVAFVNEGLAGRVEDRAAQFFPVFFSRRGDHRSDF